MIEKNNDTAAVEKTIKESKSMSPGKAILERIQKKVEAELDKPLPSTRNFSRGFNRCSS